MTKQTLLRSCCSAVMGMALLAGCQSDPYKEAGQASDKMADAKSELLTDKSVLTMACDDLNDLVYHPATDLRPQYEKFSGDVSKLNKSVASSMKTNKSMTAKRQDYLADWRAQASAIQDTDLRMRAMENLKTREASFEQANDKMMAANDAMAPVLADLNAIDKYLGADLTATSIKSVSDRATAAKNKSITVNQKYDEAITELDKVSDEIAPMTTTQPAAASGMK